jgi:hypothetical protein
VVAAIGLLMLGGIFGLNGEQWRWWRWAATACAGLVLIVALLGSKNRFTVNSRRSRFAIAAGGVVGTALVALSVVVMAERYSDPYSGPLFWPHVLAVTALIGLLLVVVSAAIWTGRPDHHT